ncbi:hypothetical protein KUCAC02_036720 [Chaenocephalus aceratus]|nr:hypothetical protein KUCAC02_036720 [Chaenocephalus aceratus]
MFTGPKAITEQQNAENTGSGTWTVKANKDNADTAAPGAAAGVAVGAGVAPDQGPAERRIVYEYKAYQPKGSHLNVTGKMKAVQRSKVTIAGADAEAIEFKEGTITDPVVDTLEIDGAYKATLTFTYKMNGAAKHVTASDYDAKIVPIFTTSSVADASATGAKIEFTYDAKTIILDEMQLQKLLRVKS